MLLGYLLPSFWRINRGRFSETECTYTYDNAIIEVLHFMLFIGIMVLLASHFTGLCYAFFSVCFIRVPLANSLIQNFLITFAMLSLNSILF